MRVTEGVLLAALLFVLTAGCRPADGPSSARATEVDTAPIDRLADDEAGRLVRRAIEYAGGWEAWENAQTLGYRKTTIYFDEEGGERERVVQRHRYVLHPTPRMRIEYEEEGRDVVLINDGDEAWKWIDGGRVTTQDDRDHAWNSTFGSHYVMAMPFKLADPGAVLTYAGRDTIDGTPVKAVRVEYEDGAGSAGGMHTWTYYFAADDARLIANHLRYGDGPGDYDLTRYEEIRKVGGLRLPMRRVSYHSNAVAEKLSKVSAYLNEDVRINALLPDSLFVLSDR